MTDAFPAWSWEGRAAPADLILRDLPVEAPRAGEVVVRNAAIGLNPVDWKLLESPPGSWMPGHVPGVDGAGVVVAVGDGVPGAWIGRRVAYHGDLRHPGSFAARTRVMARALLAVPEEMAFERAASLPCPALTAWLALDRLPQREAPILVSGAGGGVGLHLVQMAARRGFVVTALCHERHWERLRAAGAADCVVDASGQTGRFFAIVDTLGPAALERLLPALHPASGHLVSIGGRLPGWPCPPFDRTPSLHEVALGALHVHGDDADFRRLTDAGSAILRDVQAGRLAAEPLVVADFDELPQLLDALRHRSFSGKPVVRVASLPTD